MGNINPNLPFTWICLLAIEKQLLKKKTSCRVSYLDAGLRCVSSLRERHVCDF